MAMEKLGEYAFLACIVIAVLAGLATGLAGYPGGAVSALLVVLGVVVGVLNISEKETTPFLVAAIALVAAATVGFSPINDVIQNAGTVLDSIFQYIATFVAPGAIIVAFKAIYALASKK
jgi:hypothetical protein